MDRKIDIVELHRLPDDALLDVHEAAAFLGMSYKSLNTYRSNREMAHRSPPFMRGKTGTIRYPLGGIREWMGIPRKSEG